MYKPMRELVHVAPAKKTWTIATARQHLPEVVSLAAIEPQHVYRRHKLVAAIVSPELANEVEARRQPSLAAKLAELQQLCAEEAYELSVPPRQDRRNALVAPRRTRKRRAAR
jgi:hypothetical protein